LSPSFSLLFIFQKNWNRRQIMWSEVSPILLW